MSSSVLYELKTKLDALGTLGTIKVGFMPATPDAVACLYEYSGLKPFRGFGVTGIQYEYPSVQLAFRGAPFDYGGPRNLAEIAYRYLMTLQPGALGAGISTVYYYIDAIQEPHPIEQIDKNNRHKIGINFRIKKDLSL